MVSRARLSLYPKPQVVQASRFLQLAVDYLYRPTLQWAGTCPPTSLPSPEVPGSYLIHGSLIPPESATQTASRSVQPVLQGSQSCPTDTQTDHATSAATGCIFVLRACDAAYNFFGLEE